MIGSFLTILPLILSGGLNILLSVFLYLLGKFWEKKNWNKAVWQILVGVLFGLCAIEATEHSIDVSGAGINVRDAAPLCAGLIFGGPAGIIAGMIGGIERYVAVAWGAGSYTRIACTLATCLAGVFAAILRKLVFDSKIPSVLYGLFSGITMETLHMLAVFLTHPDDIPHAFEVVKACTLPMIGLNSLTVMAAILFIHLLSYRMHLVHELRKLSESFQRALLLCILIMFILTFFTIQGLETQLAVNDTQKVLQTSIQDVNDFVAEASNAQLRDSIHSVMVDYRMQNPQTTDALASIARENDVAEINIINREGIVCLSSNDLFNGYDMHSGKQSAEFLDMFHPGADYFGFQEFGPISFHDSDSADTQIYRKYGAYRNGDELVQVGYDSQQYQDILNNQLTWAGEFRHIENAGYMVIADSDCQIISGPQYGKTLQQIGLEDITLGDPNAKEGLYLKATIDGVSADFMYQFEDGYYVIALVPRDEVIRARDLSTYMMVFMQTLTFAALFISIYYLIRKLIVENIQKVNHSLSEITGGNLDTVVDVRSNAEFASLSDDINSTVLTLKRYIAEAAARIDKELEFAKTIQLSCLPVSDDEISRAGDFQIFASSHAAKVVGGDFYDFYYIDDDHFAITIADVSGKGIPAALFMMRAKATLKSLAEKKNSIDVIFTETNSQLCEGNDAGMFVTGWMGILDLRTGLIQYACAGHNPPIVMRKGQGAEYIKGKPGFVFAGMEGVRYKIQELQLLPGDQILLYTDGVTEAVDTAENMYGEDRLLQYATDHQDDLPEPFCHGLREDMDRFVGEADQFDDITMLSLRYTPEKREASTDTAG